MTPTFRYNPAVLAQAFATLGCLYPDRVIAGFGTGEALNEIATGFRGAGEQDWPEFKERFARLRESVRLMRELWIGDRVSFEGEYYSTHDASIYDVPEGGVPVYIAAGGPTVAKYAGRAGDGFICTSGKGAELYVDQLHPGGEGGRRGIRPIVRRPRPHDRDQALVRGDRGGRAREHPLLVAAVALEGAEARHHRPGRDGARGRRPADRGDRQALDRRHRPRRGRRRRSASTWTGASTTSSSTRPGHDQRRFLELFERDLAPRLRAR